MFTYNSFSLLLSRLFKMCKRKLSTFIFSNKRSSKTSKTLGFTLLEILAVLAIAGVLSAIAAPSWLSFVNNQRINASQTKIFTAIKTAQSEAKIRQNDTNGNSKITFTLAPTSSFRLDNVRANGGQEQYLDPGIVIASVTGVTGAAPYSIVFDSRGFISDPNQTRYSLPICINLAVSQGSQRKRWIKIQTLLGALVTGTEDNAC